MSVVNQITAALAAGIAQRGSASFVGARWDPAQLLFLRR
jgi:hypothetical protein